MVYYLYWCIVCPQWSADGRVVFMKGKGNGDGRKETDCKRYQKMIPAFLEQKMNYRSLKMFCDHIQACEECREELTIQFLISEGLARLEEGDAFDLNRELAKHLLEARKKLARNERFVRIGMVAELFVMAGILSVVFWVILN